MPTDGSELFYGQYTLTSATLITLPQWTSKGLISSAVPRGELAARDVGDTDVARRKIVSRYHPYARKRAPIKAVAPPPPPPPLAPPPPPPPPPPPISGVGVMDVGQGNCNLLLDANVEPLAYFDVGYPLWFYVGSLPANMRFGNAAYLGPIPQNAAANLEVVLSHWDWDHWRLGHVAGLAALPWLYPMQPVGPVTAAFIAGLANGNVYGGAPVTALANYTIYQCVPPLGAPAAMLMNNSGLALQVQTNLPVADPAWHTMIMTGDANFDTLPIHPVYPALTGITAVHHGSNAHGAAANLPAPVAPYAATGRIGYSYGVRQTAAGALVHCYGFPVPAAVAAYHAAGWNNEESTAEGANINAAPPAVGNRGNIRMGNQTALNAAYNGTAFFNFPNQLT